MKLINLRKLIREYIDEMAYGGLVGPTINAKFNSDSEKHINKKNKSATSLEKFHRNHLYLRKATAAFKHFPFDVWIQPVSAGLYEEFDEVLFGVNDEDNRYDIMSVDDISVYNEEYNFPIDIDKIRSITGAGGCVIFSMTGDLRPNFLPTPWMIIHAIFDSGDHTKFGGISYEIEEYIQDELEIDPLVDILPHMTMGSATLGNMTNESEIMHELCVQEVITTNGVHFKKANDSELNEKLEMLKEKIKSYNLKDHITDAIRGKVVVVSIQ